MYVCVCVAVLRCNLLCGYGIRASRQLDLAEIAHACRSVPANRIHCQSYLVREGKMLLVALVLSFTRI